VVGSKKLLGGIERRNFVLTELQQLLDHEPKRSAVVDQSYFFTHIHSPLRVLEATMAPSDDDYNEKLKRIIRQAQELFLQDAASKMTDMEAGIRQWMERGLSFEQTADLIHRHVHALKGVALTIQYEDIDQVCEQILEQIHTVQDDRSTGKVYDAKAEHNEMNQFIDKLGLLKELLVKYG
jgi:HPt (histidine-containing phosphotransfer) domain-containing protein